jgi:hypothetical protein
VAGQVALIEVAGEDSCLTGIVIDGSIADRGTDTGEDVVIDLGSSPGSPSGPCEVVASFFAPDALYRVTATAVPHNGSAGDKIIDLRVQTVERVQRRATPRSKLSVHAVLSNFDEPGALVSVVGETVDLGAGGCRVQTRTAFPSGCDPTVTLSLEDGSSIVSLAAVLQAKHAGDIFEYRLVFLNMEDKDRLRLSELVAEPVGA